MSEDAKLFAVSGAITLMAFISPYTADTGIVRELHAKAGVDVFVDAPLSVVEERDPKGLYKKARAGHLTYFWSCELRSLR